MIDFLAWLALVPVAAAAAFYYLLVRAQERRAVVLVRRVDGRVLYLDADAAGASGLPFGNASRRGRPKNDA